MLGQKFVKFFRWYFGNLTHSEITWSLVGQYYQMVTPKSQNLNYCWKKSNPEKGPTNGQSHVNSFSFLNSHSAHCIAAPHQEKNDQLSVAHNWHVKRRFMYQNQHSKSLQLPFDQKVQIVIPQRSPVSVPEPIRAPSDGILHQLHH